MSTDYSLADSYYSNALDSGGYASVVSLDLSAAFDVVDHKLLIKRLKIMNLPPKLVGLLEQWLLNRSMYVTVNDKCSIFTEIIAGTLQGSCLGPILFALFTAPLHNLTDCITFADDNYSVETGKDLDETIGKVKMKADVLMNWLKDSGMQVNSSKTEFCIFHKMDTRSKPISLFGETIYSKNEMKILGVNFDSKLNWTNHVNKTLCKCKKSLQAIKLISKHFTIDEKLNIVTSIIFSKLYYGAEIWLIPTLKRNLRNKFLNFSTKALKIAGEDIYNVFNQQEIHLTFKRFTPDQMINYTSLLAYFKCFNYRIPENIWINLQFQSHSLTRANKTLIAPKK